MVGRPGQIPDLTKGSRSRSKFKGGIPRHVPLAILAETLQGDGDPHTQGELLPMFGLGTPNPRGPLIWVSGVHAAQTVCGLPGFGCCSMVGLCSRLGLCSGLGLYKGLGICSGCWKCTGQSWVPQLVLNYNQSFHYKHCFILREHHRCKTCALIRSSEPVWNPVPLDSCHFLALSFQKFKIFYKWNKGTTYRCQPAEQIGSPIHIHSNCSWFLQKKLYVFVEIKVALIEALQLAKESSPLNLVFIQLKNATNNATFKGTNSRPTNNSTSQ